MRSIYAGQRGSVLVLFAITIPLLFLLSAIGFDVGYVYLQRAHMQNIADAAVLAGAQKLNGTVNDSDARDQTSFYINQNNTTADTAANQNIIITHPYKNDLQKIQVTLSENVPLFFFKYFGYTNMPVSVSAAAIKPSSGKGIFDYGIISASSNGILDLGPGGGNLYNVNMYSNNKVSQGGGNNTVNGEINTVNNSPWSTISQNSFFGKYTLNTSVSPIDISLQNSGLSNLVQQIKAQNLYSGDYKGSLNLQKLGKGLYVQGAFKPGWIEWNSDNSSLNATTIIIAEGDITFPSNNGMSMNSNNYVIYCSLNGNIDFTYNGPFYGILYAPNGKIKLSMGGSTYYGSIVGQTVTVGYGATTINYKNYLGTGSASGKIKLIE